MMKNSKTYQLSVNFYRDVQNVQLRCQLRDQLLRAAASVPLNLMEGYGKLSRRDRRRFYCIAFGSIRELQAICEIADLSDDLKVQIDSIAACTYKLIKSCE